MNADSIKAALSAFIGVHRRLNMFSYVPSPTAASSGSAHDIRPAAPDAGTRRHVPPVDPEMARGTGHPRPTPRARPVGLGRSLPQCAVPISRHARSDGPILHAQEPPTGSGYLFGHGRAAPGRTQ